MKKYPCQIIKIINQKFSQKTAEWDQIEYIMTVKHQRSIDDLNSVNPIQAATGAVRDIRDNVRKALQNCYSNENLPEAESQTILIEHQYP